VGVLLDASAQHAGRTGREVLTIGAVTMGLPMSRVDEMIELVSLSPREAKRRVKNYSLGMRQRLGIAHALLGDPSILILDEPANGLDPAGIHWMRGLLREYAERGGTVCLSSHLLTEVERIADELILIGQGRIVAQGTKQELLQTRGAYVRAVETDLLVESLRREGIAVLPSGDGLRSDAEAIQIGKVAAAHHITLIELRPADGEGLEELFLQLTAETQRDGVVA
jgi:ABC-2 type transport system ATP-binding protein